MPLFALILPLLILFSCGKSEPPSPQPAKTYTITFDSREGSAVAELKVEAGKQATKPTDPTKTGYTFDGWYQEVALTNAFNFETETITGNITLYAKWVAEGSTTYTVTFDSREGSAVDALEVEVGKQATKPTDPTKTGYTFGGWYKEVALTNVFDFSKETITGNITLYAKWVAEGSTTYTVTFDSREGSAVAELKVEVGKQATKPTDPTRTGYTFDGWYQEVALTNAFDFETETITGNITLYAKWKKEETTSHTVTFDSREGSAVAELKVEAGKQATKPTDPTKTGYTFDGWYQEVALTNVFDFSKETVTGNITLYAKWKKEETTSHTVTFDSREGSAVAELKVEAGKQATKPTDPTKTGYTFDGWYQEVALTNVFDFSKETVTGNITLYAKWKKEETTSHTVTLDSREGSAVAELKVEAGKQATKPTDPTKTGYTFDGWYQEVALTNVFDFSKETVTGNITLYAKWKKEETTSHTVTLDSQGGSAVDALEVEAGAKATKPTDPIRTDYTFDGWYQDKELTTIFNFETETINEDITLYAKWQKVETVVVTFERIGDRGPTEFLGKQNVVKGESLNPKLFEKSPYALIDLFTDSGGTQVFDRTTVIEANRTLYVKWVARPKDKGELIQLIDAELTEKGNKEALNFIDTHLITDMSNLFGNKISFNGDISGWDVAAVTNMSGMFHNANAFNGDISGWNVVAVTNMSGMFYKASAFNGDISGWNVATVTTMYSMFLGAIAFNGDISGWNVATVTAMYNMFQNASAFNQDISGWNVAAVTNMSGMFYKASAFNRDLESWDVASSVDKRDMFTDSGLTEDAQPSWYRPKLTFVTAVEGISVPPIYLLAGGTVNGPFPPTREGYAFQHWSASEGGGEAFDFSQAITTDITLHAEWKKEETVVVIFKRIGDRGPKEFLGERNVVKGESLNPKLFEKPPYTLINLYTDAEGAQVFDITTVIETNRTLYVKWGRRPKNKEELIQLINAELTEKGNKADLNFIDTRLITDMSNLFEGKGSFNGDVSGWDVAAVTNTSGMFSGAIAFNKDISGWNVVAVRDMSNMFSGAIAFNKDISGWNVAAVRDMSYMFSGARAFNQDISGWEVATVTNMSEMFYAASTFNQDLENWDVVAVTNMAGMFENAIAFNRDISGWNVVAVRNMSNMFSSAIAFNQDISGWNVATVTNMESMFNAASAFNQDISGWNVAAVANMNLMFNAASAFNQDISAWNVASLINKRDMFTGSGVNSDNNNVPSWY